VAALNLRLSDEEMERLRAQAAREHRSMNEVARLAVLSRIEDAERRERVLALTDQVMSEHAYTLERLKDL
jgi:plasmid stability protein